ncbi:MAG: T9SS type A sorting domain-containing protein [Vicingaceae bacterium]|nr:T9SS type A sorting domain-containing protein [Vicingaceae bacterium]
MKVIGDVLLKKLTLLSMIVALVFSSNLNAQRLRGSEFSYQCVGPNTYSITYYYYYNCNNVGMPSTIDIDWTGSCGSGSQTLTQQQVVDVTPICPTQQSSCNGGTGTYGVERVSYTGVITFPPGCSNIDLSNTYSNRTAGSNNVAGGAQLLYVENTLDNSVVPCNSSPQFLDQPIMYTLTNGPNSFSNEAFDPDGDSLVYYIVPALKAPSISVTYNGGYTAALPFGIGIPYSINSTNGTITYTGAPVAGTTVLAILVEEYRNGVLIGSVTRDWVMEHFTSANANKPVLSGFNGGPNITDTVCPPSFCVDIFISDADVGDVIGPVIIYDSSANFNFSTSGTNPVTATVCWNSSKPMIGGTYYFSLEASDGACPIPLLTTKQFSLTIRPGGLFTDTHVQCDSLAWIDGNTYDSTNTTATHIIPNGSASGCDSIITLDLTINNTALTTDTYTECDSLPWIDGNTYFASNNTATHVIPNGAASGCDSVITLDLTINGVTVQGVDTINECSNSLLWIDGNTYLSNNNTATHTVGSVSGCDSIVTLNLTFINVDTSISKSNNNLTANAAVATFQWLDCDSNLAVISGENNQLFVPTKNGNYAVQVTQSGCTDTSSCINVTGVGIRELESIQHTVYPNPTNNIINIQFKKFDETTSYEITSISGQRVLGGRITNVITQLDLTDESKGIYLLKVVNNETITTHKIIKQ